MNGAAFGLGLTFFWGALQLLKLWFTVMVKYSLHLKDVIALTLAGMLFHKILEKLHFKKSMIRALTCETVVWCFLDPEVVFLDQIACSITLSASSFCVSLSGWSIPSLTIRLSSGRSTWHWGGFLQAMTWGMLWGRWSVARPNHREVEPGWRITTVEACRGY